MKIRLSIIFVSIALCCSCHNDAPLGEAKKTMGKWFKKKIILPKKAVLLNGKYVSENNFVDFNNLDRSSKYYIIHYFDAGCDKCINGLTQAQRFIERRSKKEPVKYVFIGSALNDVFAKEAIKSTKFQYPVYFEEPDSSFKRYNHLPLQDPLYNTLLINNKCEVLLFGSVFENKKATEFYFDIINDQL